MYNIDTLHLGIYSTHEKRAVNIFKSRYPNAPIYGLKSFRLRKDINEVIIQIFTDKGVIHKRETTCYYISSNSQLISEAEGNSLPTRREPCINWLNYLPLTGRWIRIRTSSSAS